MEKTVPVISTPWSTQREEHRFPVYDPSDGSLCAVVQGCGAAEVDRCVRAAHKVFESTWRWVPPHGRGALLKKAALALEDRLEELAELETREVGKRLSVSRGEVRRCVETFQFFGGLVGNLPGECYELGAVNAYVYQEPFGVVAGVIPFNWPAMHSAAKIAPALAAGNTMVVKPGDQAPLTILRIVEIVRSALPEGVLEAVAGPGLETGKALTSHPLVRKISFTGSDRSGRAILRQAAENLTPALMELGGKNPILVLEGCDLDKAAATACEGAFFNNGEACIATSRILVQRSLLEPFTQKLLGRMDRLKVGSGMDPGTSVGPMVTREHQQRVLSYIQTGLSEGARIVKEIPLPRDPALEGGYYVPPTLFADADPGMRIAREEIFGPVACIIPFEDEEEGVRIANDTDFGLVAVVFCGDYPRASRIARQLDVGCVYLNNFHRLGPQCVPFGGNKASGFGRERCIETLREFSRAKAVRVPSGMGEIPLWLED